MCIPKSAPRQARAGGAAMFGLHELVRGSLCSLHGCSCWRLRENDGGGFFLDLGYQCIKYCMENVGAGRGILNQGGQKDFQRLRESNIRGLGTAIFGYLL